MNNLKRVFSLALTGVMLSGMMVMGASAVEFSDSKDIVNADAVNTMVALNIINGRDDGSFDPTGLVTRAEMAKMISVAMNGGEAPNFGTKTTPTFTDIKGCWAEQYIEYCNDMKIISGRGDGTFDPYGNVTGVEAAKMVLTALGYDATAFQLVGPDWAVNTTYEATTPCSPSLYTDLNGVQMNQPLTRDNAAQMIWNGVQNDMTTKRPDKTLATGEVTYIYQPGEGDPFITIKYGAVIEYAYLKDVDYNEDKEQYEYTLSAGAEFGAAALTVDQFTASGTVAMKEDLSKLYGQKVKVVYTKKNSSVDKVYGIFATESSVLASGVVGDLPNTVDADADSVKLNGTTVKLAPSGATSSNCADQVAVFGFLSGAYNTQNLTGIKAYSSKAAQPFTMDLIDNDGDGKANCAVIYPFTVAKVTSVGSTSFSAGSAKKFKDVDVYEGVAKGDYVKVTDKANIASGKETFEKIEVIKDVKTAATRENNTKFKIDDTWYTINATTVDNSLSSVAAGVEVSKLVAVNGYAFHVTADSTVNAGDYVVVTKAENTSTGKIDGARAELVFADGSKKVVSTDKYYGGDAWDASDDPQTKFGLVNTLATYKINDDGEYVLTKANYSAGDDSTTGFDSVITGSYTYDKDGKSTIGTSKIADDAVIFVADKANTVVDGTAKVKVVSGAELKKTSTATVNVAYTTTDNSTGYATVRMAFVFATISSSDHKVGYIVSDVDIVADRDDKVGSFTMFDGTEDKEVLTKNADGKVGGTALAKGMLVVYVEDGSKIDVKYAVKTDGTGAIGTFPATLAQGSNTYGFGALVAVDLKGELVNLAIAAATEDVDEDNADENVFGSASATDLANLDISDAVILGIDTDGKAGVPGAELAMAERTPDSNSTNYYANVFYVIDRTDNQAAATNDKVAFLVYCNDMFDVMP